MRPILTYSAVLAAAALAALLVSWSPVGGQLDFWAYDFLLRIFPPEAGRSQAIILSIDEDSISRYGGILQLRRPLGEALQIVAEHEPAVVAIDVILSEARTPEENEPLQHALDKLPRLTLATSLTASSNPENGRWEEPAAEFASPGVALGHVHAEPDADGVCRRILLAKAAGKIRRWAMALEAYRLAIDVETIRETPDAIELDGRVIPTPYRSDRELLIRYADPESPIDRLPLREVLENPASAEAVRGRAVFVGVQVLGGIDQYLMTPYSYGEPMTGVEINANAYETLARGELIRQAPASIAVVAALLTAWALGVVFWKLTGRVVLFAALGMLLAAHLLPVLSFESALIVLPASQALMPAWSCFLVGGGYHYLVIRRRLAAAEAQTDRYQRAVHYVTHEMRTPLTAIQGSSELISRYDLPEEKRKRVAEMIHSESQRLARMVEMFLGVERLSAGRMELKREPIDADELLAECIERIRPVADKKRIRIEHRKNGAVSVEGDREFLEYACYNLLSNAVKYSPAETAVTVRAWQEKQNVLLCVEDQGYGMDESDLRNIFKKFYRARTAGKSGEAGSGLGLALVEEIVAQHGGSVQVESEIGRGSRFTLTLPQRSAEPAETN